MTNTMRKRYPKANVKAFLKATAVTILLLAIFHWLPELMTWIYAEFLGKTIVINEKRWGVALVFAYALSVIPVLFELSGMLYATWQNRKLEREEQSQS